MVRALVALLSLSVPTACVSTWSEYPRAAGAVHASPTPTYRQTLYYDIAGAKGLFGGSEALRDALREDTPFARVERRSEPPTRGLFCGIQAERRGPNVASGVAAYISYALLFTIPFWSTEGYTVRYQLYSDGEEQKNFEYDLARKSFFWIVALPFSWISLITPSERDAFEATVHQFYADATPYFRAYRTSAR